MTLGDYAALVSEGIFRFARAMGEHFALLVGMGALPSFV